MSLCHNFQSNTKTRFFLLCSYIAIKIKMEDMFFQCVLYIFSVQNIYIRRTFGTMPELNRLKTYYLYVNKLLFVHQIQRSMASLHNMIVSYQAYPKCTTNRRLNKATGNCFCKKVSRFPRDGTYVYLG